MTLKRDKPAVESASGEKAGSVPLMTLGAIGVVFGDIGTSPLYALGQCLKNLNDKPSAASVLGILSLIFWSLIFVVCVKYLTFILKADHDGEGGTLAMLALIQTKRPRRSISAPSVLVLMVLFGSALLYGDGIITPSISVLSAVEGLKIATPSAQPYVIPISIAILVGLFLLQHRGTGQIGRLFGPVMVIWFVAIAIFGIYGIVKAPAVLHALNPVLGFEFLFHNGWQGVLVLGAVVLCFTGAEALFADLSHFGRLPIQLGWYVLVLPALVVNYFGQGALLLLPGDPTQSPFFALVPHYLLYPMVALATAATVIASQALISGTFTLTQQAIHMGFFPRLRITQTSKDERGQVYIGSFNYFLMICCIVIVLVFRSSDNLGSAYGLAVIGTMLITSLTYYFVLREVWKWSWIKSIFLTGCFIFVDLSFLAGNAVKIISGAWVPIVIALGLFGVFWLWTACSAKYRRSLNTWAMSLDEFKAQAKSWKSKHAGTGVFLTTHPNSVPLVGKNHWLREHAGLEQIVLITVTQGNVPYTPIENQIQVTALDPGFWQVSASFGFMQQPDITAVLTTAARQMPKMDWDKLVVFLPEADFKETKEKRWKRFILSLYEFLKRNSLSTADYFQVPPREIIHVGVRLDL